MASDVKRITTSGIPVAEHRSISTHHENIVLLTLSDMTQSNNNNTILNGPAGELTMAFKDAQHNLMENVLPKLITSAPANQQPPTAASALNNTNGIPATSRPPLPNQPPAAANVPQQQQPQQPPPLQRLDSRAAFGGPPQQQRPGSGTPLRPQFNQPPTSSSPRPPLPPNQIPYIAVQRPSQPQLLQQRPQSGSAPPPRGTSPQQPQFAPRAFSGAPPPRSPLGPRPPGLFQQQSLPSPRAPAQYLTPAGGNTPNSGSDPRFVRSQTLDPNTIAAATASPAAATTPPNAPSPTPPQIASIDPAVTSSRAAAMAAMKNRSMSVATPEMAAAAASSPPQSAGMDMRRMSVSSIGSTGSGADILVQHHRNGRNDDGPPPPRPESRADSGGGMKRIDERMMSPTAAAVVAGGKAGSRPESAASVLSNSSVELKKFEVDEATVAAAAATVAATGSGAKVKGLDLKSPNKSEGDNDSGVDESTQGNDSNGERSTPRKPITKSGRNTATPTKHRSLSRGGKSPNLLSPDSPGPTEKKKLPMNKIQVGSAPSPNLKVVKSKIGSLQNAHHKPGGGHIKIEHKKIDLTNTTSRIAAKNDTYAPAGGDKKIVQQKLHWQAKSKIGSLDNAQHKPKGGDKKIETVKLEFKDKAKPRVGSKDNMKHTPGGGDVKSDASFNERPKTVNANPKPIETKKIELNVGSKVGSFDNVKHRAGGGDKKIFDDKEYLRQTSATEVSKALSASQVEEYNSMPDFRRKSVRILDTVLELEPPTSRPTSRLSRIGSGRKKRSQSAIVERPRWRF